MVVHGEAIEAMQLPALVAEEREGLATYRLHGEEAELVTLDAAHNGENPCGAKVIQVKSRIHRCALIAHPDITLTG